MTAVATRVDWRVPERRREAFQDFYEFHLKHGAHPGVVYMLMPWLRERVGWDEEEALWFAFLNGNTQNPVTSLILHRRGPLPEAWPAVVELWRSDYKRLAWDTDRRYHKKSLPDAIESYVERVQLAGSQSAYWREIARQGWQSVWKACSSLATFGRLSAWSYAEYLRIMGVDFDCDDLMLDDLQGSRSHRNGLCIVTGREQYDWHSSNPGFNGRYSETLLRLLAANARGILDEAQDRAVGKPWRHDVGYLTLESTLCTYKGWHRVNRRYPGVYLDMLHDRIRAAAEAWPDEDLSLFWQARAEQLPKYLRLEDVPGDPGLHQLKQNHYRQTGEVPVLGHEYPKYWSTFDENVRSEAYGRFR